MPKTVNKPFQFEITYPELRWLAEILGYIQFPLLAEPESIGSSLLDARSETLIAQNKIQERGFAAFVRGSGWQIEKLIIAISQIMVNPEVVQVIQLWKEGGKLQKFLVYPLFELPLVIEEGKDELTFTIYPEKKNLLAQIPSFFVLPVKTTNAKTSLCLSRTVIQRLPSLISSPKKAIVNQLSSLGMDNDSIEKLVKIIGKSTHISVISNMKTKDGDLEIDGQKYIFWDSSTILAGVWGFNDEVIRFETLSLAEAKDWILEGL